MSGLRRWSRLWLVLLLVGCGDGKGPPQPLLVGIWFTCSTSLCTQLETGGVQLLPDGAYLTLQRNGEAYCERTGDQLRGSYSFDGQKLKLTPRGAIGCDTRVTLQTEQLAVSSPGCGLGALMKRTSLISTGSCRGDGGVVDATERREW
jgi:hypothetical protein